MVNSIDDLGKRGDGDRGVMAIPLSDSRVVGAFIAELLGKRRVIERNFSDRRFEIDFPWLLNLDSIIQQRVNSQNDPHLISFAIQLYFDNGKIVQIEDYNAFRNYHDISPDLSVGVTIEWTYIIKFPLNKIPEKQQIQFNAFTDIEAINKKKESKSASIFTLNGDVEKLSYYIAFTDLTWGGGFEPSYWKLYFIKYTAASCMAAVC